MSKIGKMVNDFICCASNIKHVINESALIQACGKYACSDCISNNNSNEFYCNTCKQNHSKLRIPLSSSVLDTLNKNRNEFDRLLNNKLEYEEKLEEKFNVEYLNNEFNNKLELFKNEIDLRIDSLKSKLDDYRDDLFKRIKDTQKYVSNEILTNNNIDKVRDKYKPNVTINDYSQYDAKLKQLKNDFNELNRQLPVIQYKSSDADINMNIICDLTITIKDKLDFDSFSGKYSIPLSDSRLATCYYDIVLYSSIKICNYDDGIVINELKGHSMGTICLAELSNNRLASGSSDSTIKIWDLNNCTCIKTLGEHSGYVQCLKTLSNNRLASGSKDNTIKIWNTQNYECISTLEGHSGTIRSLEYISNNRLVSGSHDKKIKIWNLDDNSLIKTLEGHNNYVTCVKEISNDQMASGDMEGIIKIWSIDDYSCIKTLNTGYERLISCIILISNNRLISGCNYGTIKVWNVNDCSLIKTLTGHKRGIRCLISLKNNNIVSVCDYTYKVWCMDDYNCIKTIKLGVT
jgi:WD40 repeat protein